MERIITNGEGGINHANAISYEKAAAEFDNENEKAGELSCSLLLKNLLKTNLRLSKLNELSAMLLF